MNLNFKSLVRFDRLLLLTLLALPSAVFLAGLNRAPVPPVDASIRAIEARHVVRSGQWFPLIYEGKEVYDHPPLYVWLEATCMKIFGINDFAVNFPGRLCAVITVILTWLLAIQAGLSKGAALFAVIILCATRDFVLNSVRGYLEPLFEMFIYGGLWFLLRGFEKNKKILFFVSGICVWLAAFTKGPPAMWPLLFFSCLFFIFKNKTKNLFLYFSGFLFCTIFWIFWNEANQFWSHWKDYWNLQVLGSALHGRGGAQNFEPFYFIKILLKFYWPWLPFFIWSIYLIFLKKNSALNVKVFATLGLGFIVGFSLVKWKFWYYIAPAYPAFALCIAYALDNKFKYFFTKYETFLYKGGFCTSILWAFIAGVFPIPLHKDRVPEVMAFKSTIRDSSIHSPVWFIHNPMDHNLIAINGEWYFDRPVYKIVDEASWLKKDLKAPAWIMVGKDFFQTCETSWCKKSMLIQTAGKSALLYFKGAAL